MGVATPARVRERGTKCDRRRIVSVIACSLCIGTEYAGPVLSPCDARQSRGTPVLCVDSRSVDSRATVRARARACNGFPGKKTIARGLFTC